MTNTSGMILEGEDVVARLGQGRLVRVSRLLLELRDGTQADELEAASWVAMFMPDFVFAPRGRAAASRG